jgi:general secretion pathway protein E
MLQVANHPHHVRVLAPVKARGIEQVGRFVATASSTAENRVVEFLNGIFEAAVVNSASDIHFEFDEFDGLEARIRKSGDLVVYTGSLDADLAKIAKTKLCAKSKLDDQERLIPQDKRMMVYFGGRRVDIRVAMTPTVAGFKIVCRLLDSANSNILVDDLEMPYAVRECMKRVSSASQGMVILSGPTGSGKTTSLYGMLQSLKSERIHIVTIENPVEYTVKGFTQIEVDGNLTFPMALKAAVRLDPDVIMVGEIRDAESAAGAQSAGTTGHMVLSTVHANSAAEVVTRLLELKLKPRDVTALSAVVAQRLIRKFDEGAVLDFVEPTAVEKRWLQDRRLYFPGMLFPRLLEGSMNGRIPIVEMIEVTPSIQNLLESDALGESDIVRRLVEAAAASQIQFETLTQAGVRIALAGKTTIREVMENANVFAYTPENLRWEQRLVYSGLLSCENLELIQQEIFLQSEVGEIVTIEDILVTSGLATSAQITEAKSLSYPCVS